MALDKKVFFTAFLVTTLIFVILLFFNLFMNNEREEAVVERMNDVIDQYEEMQSLLIMSEFFGENSTCVALGSLLSDMNKDLWELGIKIDSYRQATEEFMKDPFYLEQKTKFNRRQVLYFSMLNKMQKMCETEQTIVSFFYKKKDDCPDCDAQSFVLIDIKHDMEKMGKDNQLAVFSFDTDLGLSPINMLVAYYNITDYPCIVVENEPYCGLHSKKETINILCSENDLAICPDDE